MAKVIIVDNYGRDTVSDHLYRDGLSQNDAIQIAADMNDLAGPHSPNYYIVKPDEYKLYKFEP